MPTWTLTTHELHLRYVWKISRNASSTKTNLLLRVSGAGQSGTGEAAPNVRYDETPELLKQQFEALQANGLSAVTSLVELDELLAAQPVAHALSFALESALVQWLAACAGQPVWQWLGVPQPARTVPTAFSLPIMEPGAVAGFLQEQNAARFQLLKIKVNQAEGLELIREVARVLPGHGLLVDGNETWTDADGVLGFLEQATALPGVHLRFLEQPMPAALAEDYRYLRPRSTVPLLADESVTDTADFAEIARQFHGVNVKLMKAGGFRRGIELLRRTNAHGLLPMLGCMVETTVGIEAAMQISALAEVHDLDGFLIVKDEPFGLVGEEAGQLFLPA
ncbi:enolase C-terminal domain-like protein [Hymenobacter sp. BT770]|uniref:enolase C-terminal domain-like protein n=1 Tax=Hymenobacter sp. BT770 TaxID=2886942 RepID=UPI001D12C986|nr:enolase C-terminal domain-like protein [Hymenobacter sp. BT770]MCC3153923.1 dipeptide epimerase [Hymenobacter sp. BT770]MDO3416147.1 enolase C-terminal domain-like protein [Hymenobacter sp. BT770]